MRYRVHPLAGVTAGMLVLSCVLLAWPVLAGHTLPWEPWSATLVDSFFGDAGRKVTAIFGVGAAVLSIGYQNADDARRIAVWGWGVVAVGGLALQLSQNVIEALSRLGL